MASPIIKIKQGNGRPQQYNGPGNGLTAGELGVDLTNYAFYIGNSTGSAITFGGEISTDQSLGISDYKIPTQNAVKKYVDAFSSVASSSSFVSIKHNSTSANQSYTTGVSRPLVWNNTITATTPLSNLTESIDFSNGNLASQLIYAANTTAATNFQHRFVNNSGSTLYLLINYQIPISPPTTAGTGYNSAVLLKSAWIQKFLSSEPISLPSPNTLVYGFANTIISPLTGSQQGAITCVLSGSAIVRFANLESFSVFFRDHGGGTTIPHRIQYNDGSGIDSQTFNDGLRLQILKL